MHERIDFLIECVLVNNVLEGQITKRWGKAILLRKSNPKLERDALERAIIQ